MTQDPNNEQTEESLNEGQDEAVQADSQEAVEAEATENVEVEAADEASEESIESLKAALVEAEAKVRDEALRAQAEIQNIRRRAERDVESAHKFGQEKLIKELLAVVDTLERGIQTIDEQEGELDEAVKTIRDGSDLTLKMLVGALEKFQVKQVDPMGEPFDPQFHEAMSMIENPDAEPNSVIAVVQKGYLLNERLVRPAMVVVAKGNQ